MHPAWSLAFATDHWPLPQKMAGECLMNCTACLALPDVGLDGQNAMHMKEGIRCDGCSWRGANEDQTACTCMRPLPDTPLLSPLLAAALVQGCFHVKLVYWKGEGLALCTIACPGSCCACCAWQVMNVFYAIYHIKTCCIRRNLEW